MDIVSYAGLLKKTQGEKFEFTSDFFRIMGDYDFGKPEVIQKILDSLIDPDTGEETHPLYLTHVFMDNVSIIIEGEPAGSADMGIDMSAIYYTSERSFDCDKAYKIDDIISYLKGDIEELDEYVISVSREIDPETGDSGVEAIASLGY